MMEEKKKAEKRKEIQRRRMRGKNRLELLSKSTPQEAAVCATIRAFGWEVLRQYPIFTGRKQYYADVYVPSLRLIIEVDGGYHFTEKQKRLDANRSAGIRRLGYHVCRIHNRDTHNKAKIKAILMRYNRF